MNINTLNHGLPLPSPSHSPSINSLLDDGNENQRERLDYFNNVQSFFDNDQVELQETVLPSVESKIEKEEEKVLNPIEGEEEEDEEDLEEDMEEVIINKQQQQQPISRITSAKLPSSIDPPTISSSASSAQPTASTSNINSIPKPSSRKRPRIESFPPAAAAAAASVLMMANGGYNFNNIEKSNVEEENGGEMRPPMNLNGKRKVEEVNEEENAGRDSVREGAGEGEVGERENVSHNRFDEQEHESRNRLLEENQNQQQQQQHYQEQQNQQQQQQQEQPRRPSLPSNSSSNSSQQNNSGPMEPSIFNVEPIDEFTKHIGDWLWNIIKHAPNPDEIEIEAKIGIVLNNRTSSRHTIPVAIETILPDSSDFRFESNMTINQHKAYNQLLNSLVESSNRPLYPFTPVRYAHTKEIDSFHSDSRGGGGKIRVTRELKGKVEGKVLNVIKKNRVENLNILSPKRWFDWRISVNVEEKAPLPTAPSTGVLREKDRITYTHQAFQVDLTQVTTPTINRNKAMSNSSTHELEIEFRNAKDLIEEGRKEEMGIEGNKYLELVQVFLNNIRMLIRNAADP